MITPTGPHAPTRLPRGVPGMAEPAVRLSVPDDGIRRGDVVLRLPRRDDADAVSRAFVDPELREAGNLPNLDRSEVLETLPHLPALAASGRLLPLVVVDVTTGEILGGATLHHLDAERGIVELGYWLFPPARGRGIATRTARLLAEHAFSLGVERVALRQRRQRAVGARARASRVHAGRRRPLAPEARRAPGRQDALLAPARRVAGVTRPASPRTARRES